MKHIRNFSPLLVSLVGCGAMASVACGSSDGGGNNSPLGGAGPVNTTGAGSGVSGGPTGSGGATPSAGGADTGTAGAAPSGGSPSTGGSDATGSPGGSSVGGDGGSAGSGGRAGGGGGAAGSGGSAPVGDFGVTTCQPAFETVCKPNINFINDDPNGRGKIFNQVMPDPQTTIKDITCTACSILYRNPSEIPNGNKPTTVTVHLQDYGGANAMERADKVAQTGNATVQFELDYINKYTNQSMANAKQEMYGVLQHEVVHIYQNYGNGGTGEGMADVVRTRTGYYQRNRWQKGGSWKDPYTTSAFFYSWLTGPCAFHAENYPQHDLNLPYKINMALAGVSGNGDAAYTAVNNLFMTTFGKNADTLWAQFQSSAFK